MKPSSNPMASGSPTAQESSSPPPDERFLSRWSRLKRAQAQDAATTGGPVATDESALTSNVAAGATARPGANAGIPLLPSIDSLTADSDYAQFLQPKVPEALRRAAMKKLFSDPHFNKMDGLDTYIDDYTTFEPIPDALMKTLVQARDIIDHPTNRKSEEEVGPVAEDAVEAARVPVEDEVTPAQAGLDSAPEESPAAIEDVSSAEADPAGRVQAHAIPQPGTDP